MVVLSSNSVVPTMIEFLAKHETVLAVAGTLVASAAVSSLPPPADASAMWYRWFYKFSNTLLANVSAVRGKAQYEDDPKNPKENQ